MKTIGEILKLSKDFLAERKIESGRQIAEEVVGHVLNLKKMDLYLQFDRPIIEGELVKIREMLKRCAKGEPVQYVTGSVDFFGCQIGVDRRVLIPRPETEILVEKIAKVAKNGTLWDLCTGSGCIGIALKKKNPELQVTCADICPDALALASENARKNQVAIDFVRGDFLDPFKGQKADWIVCNPPYITEEEYEQLDEAVKGFEPKLALVGGLKFYERFAKEFPLYLNPQGKAFFEIGYQQKEALSALFPYARVELDWAGHPRYLMIN